MVNGVQKFREYFSDYKDQYVLIGGTACDVNMSEVNADFRTTKDLDIVLITEALTQEFSAKFWEFIKDGKYENRRKSNGKPQFYRFDKPKNEEFPYMLELFARGEFVYEEPLRCIPLYMGEELSSLSAILLNKEYYEMLVNGRIEIDGLIVLTTVCLIPFKAKAWLNLMEGRKQEREIDLSDIKKHKNDIIRLASILSGNERIDLSSGVAADMKEFIKRFEDEKIDLKSLGIKRLSREKIFEMLKKTYII